MKKMVSVCVAALLWAGAGMASYAFAAGGFQGYEGGVVQIKQPSHVQIHKSRTDYRIISVSGFCVRVTDARWYGDQLAVTWLDKYGKEHIYLYTTRTSYKVMK